MEVQPGRTWGAAGWGPGERSHSAAALPLPPADADPGAAGMVPVPAGGPGWGSKLPSSVQPQPLWHSGSESVGRSFLSLFP